MFLLHFHYFIASEFHFYLHISICLNKPSKGHHNIFCLVEP